MIEVKEWIKIISLGLEGDVNRGSLGVMSHYKMYNEYA